MRNQTSLDLHRLKVNSNLTQRLLVKAQIAPRFTPGIPDFLFLFLLFHPARMLVCISDSQPFFKKEERHANTR